ncbi:MAG: SufD family Fe-S cluster assembly protein [Microgenomates group bacterium]
MKNFKIINLNLENKSVIVFDKPGNYLVVFKNLSGEYWFKIISENVNVEIYGLFVGKNSDQFNIRTIQHHIAPNSSSNLLIKGVFFDKAKFFYRGLAKIEKNAQKSHAYQKNQNLVLSDEVDIDSRPDLEIEANDVFCTHGSTTGYLNPEQIFYLKTRGLSQKEAERILIEGFVAEIEEKIKSA